MCAIHWICTIFPHVWGHLQFDTAVVPQDKQYIKQILENLNISEKIAHENDQHFQNRKKQRYEEHTRIPDLLRYCRKHTKYRKENQGNCGMFLEDLSSFQKKALTSHTNSFNVLIWNLWSQSSMQLTWDVIMIQKQLDKICPTKQKISLPK